MAFIYGSLAKGEEHANSDVDIFLIGDELSYCEIMELLEPAEQQLGRTINPTIYSTEEFAPKHVKDTYMALGTRVEWQVYLQNLITTYKRKCRLVPLLQGL
ncbi:nucleotidyltransferase domain-containing protein [Sansalvadorimonas sp. 2012CJ34-2]|uniref:Nucleotidyltransferase domain-containing protein n=1 Tax=Parendozoicomonas callyspongiae TaxID=2942213 RepID=A0ABT0PHR1_9GAMM|nr:nucleotidyltransferase domain-containing protein [Sansalvadorimonas sp. 2012CJ34-2]MCL6270781.1 nucleotidyltransferase domain-containing protein [Sansalvadorimonas sp. 2012CJ34-2]